MDLKHSETSEMGKKLTLKGQSATFFSGVFFALYWQRKGCYQSDFNQKKIKRKHLKQKRSNVDDGSCCAGIFPYK